MKTNILLFLIAATFIASSVHKIKLPSTKNNHILNGEILNIEIPNCNPGIGEGIRIANIEVDTSFNDDYEGSNFIQEANVNDLNNEVNEEQLPQIGGSKTCNLYLEAINNGQITIYFAKINKGEDVEDQYYSVPLHITGVYFMPHDLFEISADEIRENSLIYKTLARGKSLVINTEFYLTGSIQQVLNEKETTVELAVSRKFESSQFGAWDISTYTLNSDKAGKYEIVIENRGSSNTKIIVNVQ